MAQGDAAVAVGFEATAIVSFSELQSRGVPTFTFNGQAGRFQFPAHATDSPSRAFEFRARDDYGGVDSTQFRVGVN